MTKSIAHKTTDDRSIADLRYRIASSLDDDGNVLPGQQSIRQNGVDRKRARRLAWP